MLRDIVIIGGGSSIHEHRNISLNSLLSNTLAIGCNVANKYFNTTCNIFLDKRVYEKDKDNLKGNPCIGLYRNLNEYEYPEVMWVPHISEYDRISKKGMYTGMLTGTAAVSLAIYLLKGVGNVYMLGFDWTKDPSKATHFHSSEEDYFGGYGKVSYYNERNPNDEYYPFLIEEGINFFNVNPSSNIETFPKINYTELVTRINTPKSTYWSQDTLQKYVEAMVEKVRFYPKPN